MKLLVAIFLVILPLGETNVLDFVPGFLSAE